MQSFSRQVEVASSRPGPSRAALASGIMPAAPSVAMIQLLPIPTALIVARDGTLAMTATNPAFEASGFGAAAARSALLAELGEAIGAFLAGDLASQSFEWSCGTVVDRRHFLVSLARLKPKSGGRALLTLIDLTAERRATRDLRREMMIDALTGLPNRPAFGDMIETRLAASGAKAADFAVLIVDLDRFSRINACLGPLVGDELLISFARRLKQALRARDVLARTGGDEFGVLIKLTRGRDDADRAARRIREALAKPFSLSGFELLVSCAVGVAFGADGIDRPEDLVRHAQFAAKCAKSSHMVEHYQSRLHDHARREFAIETELRRALDSGQLRLAYQPIWDLATGAVVKFEALARWRHDGVDVSPHEFVRVAEQSGLIVELGRWTLAEAARTLAAWDARHGGHCPIGLSVNMSALQLQRDDMPRLVGQVLDAHRLDPARLTLELTESALISEAAAIAQTIRAVKALGVTLAMDDFGTGYSNLAYLQKLPIDLLKIDRSFVRGMLDDPDKAAIVRAILSLAKALGMQTCAEGIETPALNQALAGLGCTLGQGHFYAAALDAEAAYRLWRARAA